MPQYDPVVYQEEKDLGVRSPTGALNLKKLSPRHIKIVKLHIGGKGTSAIASELDMTPGTVSRILSDPLVKSILQKVKDMHQQELDALFGNVVGALRKGLGDEMGLDANLKTIDRYVKVQGLKDERAGPETAEDVIQRMLQINIQVNNGNA